MSGPAENSVPDVTEGTANLNLGTPPVKKISEAVKEAKGSTSEKRRSLPVKLPRATQALLEGAKATLNTSYYVYVSTKRLQRAGVNELEDSYDKLATEYKTLYKSYSAVHTAFQKLIEDIEISVKKLQEDHELTARKNEAILKLVQVSSLSDFDEAIRGLNVSRRLFEANNEAPEEQTTEDKTAEADQTTSAGPKVKKEESSK